MSKKRSDQTCERMAQSARERWANPEERKKQSDRAKSRVGKHHNRSKTWDLESPNGKWFLTSSCRVFCKEHKISYDALKRKAFLKDTSKVTRGPSKGWAVIAVTEMIKA